MRKFIYLFMFLFACTSYAQTEQISGQFRLIGTQEQPEADKVLTIDDNGDVGYMSSNRPSFARFGEDLSGYTIGVEKVVEFTTTVFAENIDLSVVNSNENIKINTTGYYVITGIVNSGYSPNQNITYASIHKNTLQLGSGQSQGQGGGITVDTGVVFLEQDDLLEMRVEVNSAVGGAYLSIQKIK